MSYLEHIIRKERKFIYIKNGRWIFHLLLLFIFFYDLGSHFEKNQIIQPNIFEQTLLHIIIGLPFLCFYILIIIHLIPFYFKREKYKSFWQIFISLLFIIPLLSLSLLFLIDNFFFPVNNLRQYNIFITYIYIFSFFIGYILCGSGLLYFMEILEEIKLSKRNVSNIHFTRNAKLQIQNIKTDLPFMLQSIRAIRETLNTEYQDAAHKLLDFSQVLRYKLYGNNLDVVLIKDELEVIKKTLTIANENINLDINGELGEKFILKQALMHCIQPFIPIFTHTNAETNIIILAEKEELLLVIEIFAHFDTEFSIATEKTKLYLNNTFGENATFEIIKETPTHIQICLPLKTQ